MSQYKSSELREQRAGLYAETTAWLNKAESEGLPADEVDAEWNKRNADLDRLEDEAKAAERRERLASLEADMNRPAARVVAPSTREVSRNATGRDNTLRNWLLSGTGHEDRSPRAMERNAAVGMSLDKRSHSFDIGEQLLTLSERAVLAGSAGAGKELVPTGLPSSFLTYMQYICPILDYATIEATTDTRVYPYPIADSTANTGFIVGENTLIPDQDFATSNVNLQALKYSSGLQKLSIEFLRGSVGNPEAKVGKMLADNIAKKFAADAFSTTNTTTAPQGLLNASTSNFTLATRGTLTADSIIDLIYSVAMPYDKNLTLVMHRSTVAAVRKLKDGQNRYLWEDNFQIGQPPTIMGYPVLISQDMPTLSTVGLNKVVLAVDLSQYVVRVAGPVSVTRSDERYMEYGLVCFSALQFLDGRWVGPAGANRCISNPA